jgi:endonuclease YncB( thermonuclease family)
MRVSGDHSRRARRAIACFAIAACGLLASPARAAERIAACAEAAVFAEADALGARDGVTIQLADGREVRLAGVIAANDLDGGGAEADQRATAALDALIAGRRIALHGRAGGDRYGRLLAQVIVEDGERWVQAALVAAGTLRVAPALGEPACAAALLAEERSARAARAGIWADDRFAVAMADSTEVLLAAAGRYAIVEGSVRRVGEAGSRLFLDFGRRYSEDFSVVIPRGAQPAFAAAGIDLKAIAGKRVRARGVLYNWGGPALEVRVPAALELIEADGR